MFKKTIKVLAILSALYSSTPSLAQSTDDVWKHHIQAWGDRSLDEITSDYSDQSVLILNNQVFEGQKEIRNVFAQLLLRAN